MATGSARTRTAPRLLLPLLAALVALAVVVGSAMTAPWHAELGEPREVERPTVEMSAPELAPPEPQEAPEPTEGGVPLMLWVVIGALILLIVAIRAFLRHASLARGHDEGFLETSTGAVVPQDLAPPEPDLPALRRGVAAARSVLAGHAAPDDAVIAAWLELESAAASSGIDRAPSDTPTELTTAVLDTTRADPQATRTLLGLYHRARFAPHAVLGAADVAEAARSLERIAESWDAP